MSDIPSPIETMTLTGHEAAERRILDAWSGGRLPHGWLISGPAGIGKATLAYRFARFVLANPDPDGADDASLFGDAAPPASLDVAEDHPVARRMASGGHADLHVLQRGLSDDGKRMQTVIPVDAVRAAGHAMSLTAGEGGWRVIIVDGAEDMNPNAANALLKLLEEPPPRALLLLVSHTPGRLLPTIRSRCCHLKLSSLTPAAVSELIGHHCPDLSAEERDRLTAISDGSIGRALSLAASNGLEVQAELVALLAGLPRLDMKAAHKFADKVARRDAEAAWRTAVDLTTRSLADMVSAGARGGDLAACGYSPEAAASLASVGAMASLDRWVEVWEKTSRLFAQADTANLDRKQVMLGALGTIEASVGARN